MLTGTYPLNCTQILCRCIEFQGMNRETKAAIMKELPNLVTIAQTEGMITDKEIKMQFEHIPEVDTPIKNIGDRVFTQQRALWMNKEAVLEKEEKGY